MPDLPIPVLLGNEELLERPLTAFLCSHRVPDDVFPAIRQWVNTLHPEHDCVLCGCMSGIERYALQRLLARHIPIILVLAEAMPADVGEVSRKMPDIVLSEAMGEGRLLLASINQVKDDDSPTGSNAEQRNRWMMSTAHHIIIAYALPYGRLHQQLIGRDNVTYLLPTPNVIPTPQQAEGMGWAICRYLRDNLQKLDSTAIRSLLHSYLHLSTQRPSLLHSLMLALVVNNHEHIGMTSFPAFFQLWGPENLREEDRNPYTTKDGQTLPSLAERVEELLQS